MQGFTIEAVPQLGGGSFDPPLHALERWAARHTCRATAARIAVSCCRGTELDSESTLAARRVLLGAAAPTLCTLELEVHEGMWVQLPQ